MCPDTCNGSTPAVPGRRLTWCCSGRSAFLASLGRPLAAEHQVVSCPNDAQRFEDRAEGAGRLHVGTVRKGLLRGLDVWASTPSGSWFAASAPTTVTWCL